MSNVAIVFPHQLFQDNILIERVQTIYLVEEFLFFKQYRFHKQKIAFHRASMKFYQSYLVSKNRSVTYIEAQDQYADIRKLIPHLHSIGVQSIEMIDPVDDWLEKRVKAFSQASQIKLISHPSPLFINTNESILSYFGTKKRFFQTDFYKNQRENLNILMDNHGKPIGNKWTYDDENRLKYPKGKTPPKITKLPLNKYMKEAIDYTALHFGHHYGQVSTECIYPTTFDESKVWLGEFFQTRFVEFGDYEDAIVADELILHHSVLTPMLNVGLLTPHFIIEETLRFASDHNIPINSLEGFIRQIIGWREFIRGVYQMKGTEERTRNYWGHTRKIPESFWEGTTGIDPLDIVIKKVLATGYCHHIERLMVIGNFMLLCEFDPDDVYKWYMELFIDAYDWVMVPNVYGMSQFADGGLMSTKPYISGSNYLMKMSDFKKGEWQDVWDALFWRFMHTNRDFFLKNPRLGMLVRSFDKMPISKQNTLLDRAQAYLDCIH